MSGIALAEALQIPTIAWRRFVLDNGLVLLVHEDHREPLVHVGVHYRVGSKDESPGRSGFAHLFEHLMFGGSENLPGSYLERLKSAGALDVNGATSHDTTHYHQLVPKGMLEYTLFAEADRMGHFGPHITQDTLDQQLEIVLNEKREREGRPEGRIDDHIARGLFPPGHPYRHTVLGEETDLRAATLDDARDWCATWYSPTNAVLVLTGDVQPDEAHDLVQKHFAHIPPGPPLWRTGRWVSQQPSRRCDLLETTTPGAGTVILSWVVPDLLDAQIESLTLACDLLQHGKPSLLEQALVGEGRPAVRVHASIHAELVCGVLTLRASLADGADPQDVERRVRTVIDEFVVNPPDAAALRRIQQSRVRPIEQTVQSLAGQAALLGFGQVYEGDPEGYVRAARRLLAADGRSVQEAAKTWLQADPYVLIVQSQRQFRSVGTGPQRTSAPAIIDPGVRELELDCERMLIGGAVPLWWARGPSSQRLVLRMSLDAGLAGLSLQDRALAPLLSSLRRHSLGGRSRQALDSWLSEAGMDWNSWTDAGSHTIEITGPVHAWPQTVQLLAEILQCFDAAPTPAVLEHFERERGLAVQSLRKLSNDPQAHANAQPQRLLLGPDHPLLFDTRLAADALAQASYADLQRLARHLITEAGGRAVFVGNVAPQQVLQDLHRPWMPKRPPRPAPPLPAPAPMATTVQAFEISDSSQTHIRGACVLPPALHDVDLAQECVLQALHYILGGSFSSRLNQRLREQLHWTYGVQSNVTDSGHHSATRLLTLSTAVDPDKAEACFDEILATMAGLAGPAAPNAAEIEQFRKHAQQSLPSFARNPEEVLGALDFQQRHGLDDGYWERWSRTLEALTPEQVAQAARAVLDPAAWRWSIAGAASSLGSHLSRPVGAAVGAEPVQRDQPSCAHP